MLSRTALPVDDLAAFGRLQQSETRFVPEPRSHQIRKRSRFVRRKRGKNLDTVVVNVGVFGRCNLSQRINDALRGIRVMTPTGPCGR
jgi:hypothetical protein